MFDFVLVLFKIKVFSDNPLKFNERTKPGARIVSMCHSPGGNLVVMGDTHQNIRIFQVSEHNVERLYQIAAHTVGLLCICLRSFLNILLKIYITLNFLNC